MVFVEIHRYILNGRAYRQSKPNKLLYQIIEGGWGLSEYAQYTTDD